MRFQTWFLVLAFSPALAAPPPGHPTPAEAGQILGIPAQQESAPGQAGIVEQAIDSNQYTYVEVRTESGLKWLAVVRMPLAAGDKVRYGEGVKMTNFYSKVLKRTFPEILFVGKMVRE